MKKVLFFFSTLTALWFITTCEKNDAKPNDSGYLIFGHFYGMCGGEECIEIFKLDPKYLSEDTVDKYPSHNEYYKGQFVKLDPSDFEKVKDLKAYFPEDLLKEEQKVIGQPDAGDWGGFYIEINNNGTRDYWIIDKKQDNVPVYLHAFLDKVEESIREIE